MYTSASSSPTWNRSTALRASRDASGTRSAARLTEEIDNWTAATKGKDAGKSPWAKDLVLNPKTKPLNLKS